MKKKITIRLFDVTMSGSTSQEPNFISSFTVFVDKISQATIIFFSLSPPPPPTEIKENKNTSKPKKVEEE